MNDSLSITSEKCSDHCLGTLRKQHKSNRPCIATDQGSLSKDVFEQRMLTGCEEFSIQQCLSDIKIVLLSVNTAVDST